MRKRFVRIVNARCGSLRAEILRLVTLCLAMLVLSSSALYGEPTVGIEGKVEVLLPGPELKAKPAERKAPLNVRIASTRPHGTLVHYDLRYVGLMPGRYDLSSYLVRQDGSPADGLPAIEVSIAGLLTPEHQGHLTLPQESPFFRLGGYRQVMGGFAVLWLLAAIPLLFAGRRRKEPSAAVPDTKPPAVLERLRPLVESAGAGQLSASGKAELERLLLSHWRQRLGLETLSISDALIRLREHPEAGALLRALEDWLHRPPGMAQVDVEALLSPYAKADAFSSVSGTVPVGSSAS